MVLVGSNNMVRMYAGAMRKRKQEVVIPMFNTVEDGINALRAMIETHQT